MFPGSRLKLKANRGMDGDWKEEIRSALSDFTTVSHLARNGVSFRVEDVEWEFLPAPHRRPRLPPGRMAIYGFWFDGEWLKIGRVGPNSGPRYTSQHYTGSARSTLSWSLRQDESMRNIAELGKDDLRGWEAWIERETSHVNILLPAARNTMLLPSLEAYLHQRLRPKYEGSRPQL